MIRLIILSDDWVYLSIIILATYIFFFWQSIPSFQKSLGTGSPLEKDSVGPSWSLFLHPIWSRRFYLSVSRGPIRSTRPLHSALKHSWQVSEVTHIQCRPQILAPLVNLSKGCCENKSASFIFLIFQKLHKILNFQWSKIIESGGKLTFYEINEWVKYLWSLFIHI